MHVNMPAPTTNLKCGHDFLFVATAVNGDQSIILIERNEWNWKPAEKQFVQRAQHVHLVGYIGKIEQKNRMDGWVGRKTCDKHAGCPCLRVNVSTLGHSQTRCRDMDGHRKVAHLLSTNNLLVVDVRTSSGLRSADWKNGGVLPSSKHRRASSSSSCGGGIRNRPSWLSACRSSSDST